MKLEPTQTAQPLHWNFRTSLSHGWCVLEISSVLRMPIVAFWHNRSTGPVLQLQLHLWLANSSLKLWPTGEINMLLNICIHNRFVSASHQLRAFWSLRCSFWFSEFQDILGSRIAPLSTTVFDYFDLFLFWAYALCRYELFIVIRQTVSSMARSVSCVH